MRRKGEYNLLMRQVMELKGNRIGTIRPFARESGKQIKTQAYDKVAFL